MTARVDVAGQVSAADGKITDVDGPADIGSTISRCVANEVRSWPFPEPETEKIFTLPFHLLRQ